MTRKTLDMLEFLVFIIFVLACIALIVGVLFEQGCIPIAETERKPMVLVKKKTDTEKVDTQTHQTNLTLHWASLKKDRIQ